jgi:hypothetical protein
MKNIIRLLAVLVLSILPAFANVGIQKTVAGGTGVLTEQYHVGAASPIVGDAAGAITGADAATLNGTTLAPTVTASSLTTFGATALPQTANIIVDSAVGSDVTGSRGYLPLPFQTITAAFAVAQAGDTILVRAGTYSTPTTLLMKDNMTLVITPFATIKAGTAMNAYLLANYDTASGNTGITVTGGGTLDGNGPNQTGNGIDFGQMVYFNKVTNLRFNNIVLKDPFRFGLHAPGSTGAVIRDIRFDYALSLAAYGTTHNLDGVHLNAPTNVLVENLSGNTGDDMVYVGTGELGLNPIPWATGPANNVTVRNLYANAGYRAVRFYDGTAYGTQGIKNVTIDGVYGAYSLDAVIFSTSGGGTCNTRAISMNRIFATGVPVNFAAPVVDVTVNDCHVSTTGGISEIIWSAAVTVSELNVIGCTMDLDSSGGVFIHGLANGTLSRLNVSNCYVRTSAANSNAKMLRITSGFTFGEGTFVNCRMLNGWYLAEFNEAITGLTLIGCTIDGGGYSGSAAVSYTGAKNFGYLRMSGCNVTTPVVYGFATTSGVTHSFFERNNNFVCSAGYELGFPGGAGGTDTLRFDTQTARVDRINKITPTTGDTARTTLSGYPTSLLYYNGTTWVPAVQAAPTVSGSAGSLFPGVPYVTDNNSVRVVCTLPVTASAGDIFIVTGKGTAGWKIAQNASQTIYINGSASTTGTGGYIQSNSFSDCVRLMCTVASTTFEVVDAIGWPSTDAATYAASLPGTLTVTGASTLTGGLTVGSGGTALTKIRRTTATLTAGTVTVTDASITANSEIYVGQKTPGGTPGACYVSAKTASTNYVITSTSGSDTSVVSVLIIEP